MQPLPRGLERSVQNAGFEFDQIGKYYVPLDPKVFGFVTGAVARPTTLFD